MDSQECGLIISLLKYGFSVQSDNNNEEFILGYFDALKFNTVTNWLGFTPRNASKYYDLKIISRYQLKLLFPQGQTRKTLQDNGCYSNIWESLSEDACTLFDDYPCVSVILVNLTDSFKNQDFERNEQNERKGHNIGHWNAYGTVLEWFGELIGRLEMKDKLEKAHTCILPSIGYSDYCLLLAEENWETAMELVRKLHGVRWKAQEECGKFHMYLSHSEKSAPILSTDYMIPVFHAGSKKKYPNFRCDLTAHVNLAPGVSVEALVKQLGEGIQVDQVSGTSDCILTARAGYQVKLLRNLIPVNVSSPCESLFVSTRSTLQKELDTVLLDDIRYSNSPQVDDMGCIGNMWKALTHYAEVATANQRHMRLVQACKETVATIGNISREKHNWSFRNVVKPFIEDSVENLNLLVEAIEAADKRLTEEDADINALRKEKDDYFKQISYALEIFRNRFGSFVADITRSDCFFMETEQYDHESISSATSLILGYTRLANGFAEKVCKLANPTADLRYSFVVTSGGCDRTECKDLFPNIIPDENEDGEIIQEHVPLLVQMSELGLFDCGGTVLRLFHECSHYCGSRERKKRLHYLIEFTAHIYGDILSIALLEKGGTAEHLKEELKEFLPDDSKRKALVQSVDDVYESCRKQLSGKLTGEVKGVLIAGLKKEAHGSVIKALPIDYESLSESEKIAAIANSLGEFNCIADNLRRRMRKILMENFYSYETNESFEYFTNHFARSIYLATLHAERDFYNGCDACIKKVIPTMVTCAYERRYRDVQISIDERNYSQRLESKGTANQQLEQRVVFTLQRLVADRTMSSFFDKKDSWKLPGLEVAEQNVDAILQMIFEVFSESFADMAACTLLNAKLEDYLLAFVFENWILDESLVLSADMEFRIGAILHLCFSDQLDGNRLHKEIKEKLYHAIETLVQHGMPSDRINVDTLIERIEQFLSGYSKRHEQAEPLEQYLSLCKEQYDVWCKDSIMQDYQQAFSKMRLYEFSRDNTCRSVTAMVEAVTTGR